jgi:hypothetical protein
LLREVRSWLHHAGYAPSQHSFSNQHTVPEIITASGKFMLLVCVLGFLGWLMLQQWGAGLCYAFPQVAAASCGILFPALLSASTTGQQAAVLVLFPAVSFCW